MRLKVHAPAPRSRPGLRCVLPGAALLLGLLVACSETVLQGSDESEANRAAAALERHGVPADLVAGRSGRSSTYELRVDAADAPRARSLLTAYGMPRAARAGAAVLGSGSTLVSSPIEERARIAAAVARDVEQSLEAVDGVVEARVHLTFPLAEDQMFGVEEEARAPRASALLRHLGDVPPIAVEDVRRLVAGAVDGMAAEGVEVVFRAVRLPSAADGWESLGPFVLRSGGRTALVVVITTGLAVIAALAALLVWTRVLLRRARRHGG